MAVARLSGDYLIIIYKKAINNKRNRAGDQFPDEKLPTSNSTLSPRLDPYVMRTT